MNVSFVIYRFYSPTFATNWYTFRAGHVISLLLNVSSLHAPTSKQPGAPVNPGDRLTSYQPSWLPGTHCLFTFPAGAGILPKPQSLFMGLQKECHVHDPPNISISSPAKEAESKQQKEKTGIRLKQILT